MHPGALKILKFPGGGPPDHPPTPSHTYPDLTLRAKMVALPPSLVPAIDTFVPATSNLNKNPGDTWGWETGTKCKHVIRYLNNQVMLSVVNCYVYSTTTTK